MGKKRGPYAEDFAVGSVVVIRERPFLEAFYRDWKWHNPLKAEQFEFAGRAAKVKNVTFYHGADELYQLDQIPGIWHEQCLELGPPQVSPA